MPGDEGACALAPGQAGDLVCQVQLLWLARPGVNAWPRSAAWQARAVAKDLPTATAEYRAAQRALDDAKALVRTSQLRLRGAREGLAASLVAEARRGTRMRDLVAETNLSREWIRQLLRAAGVEPDRD